jgi:hypothetical protein
MDYQPRDFVVLGLTMVLLLIILVVIPVASIVGEPTMGARWTMPVFLYTTQSFTLLLHLDHLR